jgi:hypothetical protein
MDYFVLIGRFLLDQLIYTVNGLLEVVYRILEHWAVLVGVACGLVVLLVFDELVQRMATAAPARQGQKPPMNIQRQHQLLTGITILAWIGIGIAFPTPVPQLGAAMWFLFVLAMLVMPEQQVNTLWRSKTALLTYCAVLVAFKIVATWTMAADPREWAAVIGTVGEAQRVVAGSRSIILSIASYVSWFGVPAGYVVYLFQKFAAHPMSLRSPLARAGEVAWLIRQRPD